MNDPTASTRAPYVPPGRPVRRFVLAIALVAALLGAVWWSGIGRPLIRVEVTEVRPDGARVVLINGGRTAVELRDATFDDPRLDRESVDLPGGSLGAGESIEVSVTYELLCSPAPEGGWYVPLQVTARTVLGLDRTVTAGGVSSSGGLATVGDLACDAAAAVGSG